MKYLLEDVSFLVYKYRPDRTVRREYATAINFPCLITFGLKMNKWDRICLVYLTDTVVNRTCHEGSLKITSTFPLTAFFLSY